MQNPNNQRSLTVNTIVGTYVVILAMNMDQPECSDLRGFAIHRTDHTEHEAYWLKGMKTFKSTDPGLPGGRQHSSLKQPFQDFSWSDYSAKPGHHYTYRVLALKGDPAHMQTADEVSVEVHTHSPEGGDHDIYFNRGAAASQEYANRFGNRKPTPGAEETDPVYAWLSRGAHEAIKQFIRRATGVTFGLRVCAYEFRLPTVLNELRAAAEQRLVDVQVIYDAGNEFPRDDNRAQVAAANLATLCTERVPKPRALSHNKFIVLLENGQAVAVLTGSTNFSEGGVFGQSNVVHVVEDADVAHAYLLYWDRLHDNPERKALSPHLTADYVLPEGLPPVGTSTIFSPRNSLDALEYYARLAASARDGLFMTFAFGMNDVFKMVYQTSQAPLRYALFETLLGPGVKKAEKAAALEEMTTLRKMPENLFAVGSKIALNQLDRWVGEQLTGLNTHVKYIHTKYMLIDPLGPDPIIVSGSANFSAASTNKNDENMLIIRGNQRVAHIYLSEFMRLWNHYAYREWAGKRAEQLGSNRAQLTTEPWYLDETDAWWQKFYGDTPKSHYRQYFGA